MLGCAADQQINHQILCGHSRTLSMREGATGLWLGADDRFRGIRTWLLLPFSKNPRPSKTTIEKINLTRMTLYHIVSPVLGFFVYIHLEPIFANTRGPWKLVIIRLCAQVHMYLLAAIALVARGPSPISSFQPASSVSSARPWDQQRRFNKNQSRLCHVMSTFDRLESMGVMTGAVAPRVLVGALTMPLTRVGSRKPCTLPAKPTGT